MSIRLHPYSQSYEQYALLTDYDTDTAYCEAFRTLLANIRFSWQNDDSEQKQPLVHTLLLTTPSAYAEQAAVAANLAIVAAQSGTTTLLVDANLRTPSLQQRFGLAKDAGFSDLLLEEEQITLQKIDACLQTTFIPGLRVLGAGTSTEQGASLLLSPRLEAVIGGIRQFLSAPIRPVPSLPVGRDTSGPYDTWAGRKETESQETRANLVIFHSPPVLVGADASLIGALVEQTLLTIIVGSSTRAQAKQAQEQLLRAHAKLAGIVVLDP